MPTIFDDITESEWKASKATIFDDIKPEEWRAEPTAKQSFIEGTKDVARNTLNFLAAANESRARALEQSGNRDLAQQVRNEGEKDVLIGQLDQKWLEPNGTLKHPEGLKGYWHDIIRMSPQILGQMGATVAGGPVFGGSVMVSQIAGAEEEKLKREGIDPETRWKAALADAFAQAPLEQIGLSKALKFWRPGKTATRAIRGIIEGGGVEFLTEWLQQYPELAAEVFARGKGKTKKQLLNDFTEGFWQATKEGLYQGAVAAPFGGLTGGAGAVMTSPQIETQTETQPTYDKDFFLNELVKGTTTQQLEAIKQGAPQYAPVIDAAIADYMQGRPNAPDIVTQEQGLFPEQTPEEQARIQQEVEAQRDPLHRARLEAQARIAEIEQQEQAQEREAQRQQEVKAAEQARLQQNQQLIDQTNIEAENELSQNRFNALEDLYDLAHEAGLAGREMPKPTPPFIGELSRYERQELTDSYESGKLVKEHTDAGRIREREGLPGEEVPGEGRRPQTLTEESEAPGGDQLLVQAPQERKRGGLENLGVEAPPQAETPPKAPPAPPQAEPTQKEPWEMTREEFSESGEYDTNEYIRRKTRAKNPQKLLKYYQKKYPELKGVEIGVLTATKESGPLVNEGAVKVEYDNGKFNPHNTIIGLTEDADLVVVRHEIEHLLDIIHGKNIEGEQKFSRFRHDKFNKSDYLHRQIIKDALSQNKPVPASVLKDYPDLKQGQPETPKEPSPSKQDTSEWEINKWSKIIDEQGERGIDRLRNYLASLTLGRDFNEDPDVYFERTGRKRFVDWAHKYTRKPRMRQTRQKVEELSDEEKLSKYKSKRYKTANDEKMIGILERRIKANPSKWKTGDGVGWRVARQINRGYRIVKVYPDTKEAIIKPVADTGLTEDGTDRGVWKSQRVHIGDLVRDNKYTTKKVDTTTQYEAKLGEYTQERQRAVNEGKVRESDLRKAEANVRRTTEAKGAATEGLQAEPEVSKKTKAIGRAWTGNQWRPILDQVEIKRGKNKGKMRVTFPGGRKRVVDASEIRGIAQVEETTKETTELPTGRLIQFSENDLPYKVAYDAHRGTSFVPEERAKQMQQDFYAQIKQVHDKILSDIIPEQREQAADELKRFKQGFLNKYTAWLSAKSRTLSTMITGASNFPVRRNEKALNTEHKRLTELTEWKTKAVRGMRKRLGLDGGAAISSDDADAIEQLQAKIDKSEKEQEQNKAVNKIIRSKKLTKEQKTKQLQDEFGLKESTALKLLEPDFAGRVGIPSYVLTNNNANIRRMKERIEQLEKSRSQETSEIETDSGITVKDNVEDNRVQIFFPGKPDIEARKKLKSNGFRWAPSVGAWQRMRSPVALRIAREISGTVRSSEIEKIASTLKNQTGSSQLLTDVVNLFAKDQTETTQFKRWFGESEVVTHSRKGGEWVAEPMVLYHQTHRINEPLIEKEGFDLSKLGARKSDYFTVDGVFMKPSPDDIQVGAEGKEATQIPIYARIENPLIVKDVQELTSILKRDKEYEDLFDEHELSDREKQRDFDDNYWRKWKEFERGSYEWKKHRDASKQYLEKWGKEHDESASVIRKKATSIIKKLGYDGIIIREDRGSFGRKTVTYIAIDPKQIKSATRNTGKFDPNDPSIIGESKLIADVATRAAELIRDGVKTLRDFRKSMKAKFAEVWDKIRAHMRGLWDILNNQRGSVKISKMTSKSGAGDITTKITPEGPKGGNPFKESVVQDVVYHGGGGKIDSFSEAGPSRGALGPAYFTEDNKTAEKYAYLGGIPKNSRDDIFLLDNGELDKEYISEYYEKHDIKRIPTVTTAWLNIKNPLDLDLLSANEIIDSVGGVEKFIERTNDFSILDNIKDSAEEYAAENDESFDHVFRDFFKDWLKDDYQTISGINDDESLSNAHEAHFAMAYGFIEDIFRAGDYDGITYEDAESNSTVWIPKSINQINIITYRPSPPGQVGEVHSSILSSLKGEKGSSELVNDIVSHGANLIQKGTSTLRQFRTQMRERFSDIWHKIRHLMKSLWDTLNNQKGELTLERTEKSDKYVEDLLKKLKAYEPPVQAEKAKDITPTETEEVDLTDYEKVKDVWFGDKDIKELENKVEKNKLQGAIKKALGIKRYGLKGRIMDSAIQIYIDLKNDPSHLDKYYSDLTKEQKTIVDLSQNLPDGIKKIADQISESYKNIGLEALDEGVIKNVRDNYAARTWDIRGRKGIEALRKFGTTTRHAKHRVFGTILEGWSKGYILKVNGATNNLRILRDEITKTIQDKRFLNTLMGLTDIEGNPLVTTKQLEGYEEIKHPNFVKWEPVGKAKEKADGTIKWYGKNSFADEKGTVWERKSVYAQKDIAKNLNNILGTSSLNKIPGIHLVTKYNAITKSWILQSSFFHHLAFMRSYYLGTNHKTWQEMNIRKAYKEGYDNILAMKPIIKLAVKNGLTLGVRQDWNESFLQEKTAIGNILDKTRATKIVKDKILLLREMQADFLFSKFGAGLKAKAFEIEYRNELKRHPNDNPDVIAKRVANLINDDFGGLHLGRMGRNPTTQHIFRLFALAPDWTESNIRTMVKSIKAGSKEETELYRKFWAGVLIKGIGATVIANFMLAGGDPDELKKKYRKAWKAGHFRWLDIDITPVYKALGGDTKEHKYFSILGHFKDPTKFITHPVRSAHHKGSVVYRTIHEALTGTNWAGQKYTTLSELVDEKQLTKYGSASPIGYSQIPSYVIAQIMGAQPVQVQNLIRWTEGEMEGFDAIANSFGLGTATTYSPKNKIDLKDLSDKNASELEDLGISFNLPHRKVKFGREEIEIDEDIYRKYADQFSEELSKRFEYLMSRPVWDKMDEYGKIDLLRKARRRIGHKYIVLLKREAAKQRRSKPD